MQVFVQVRNLTICEFGGNLIGPAGYTISRAILSDAIALTRGDRYFTHDFTPFNLTSWGFHDCQRDPKAFGFGSTLGRLFLRTLPNNFTENSVYTFFPLMTPDSMKTNLTKLDVLNQYDLARPATKKATEVISTHATVASILKDKEGFVAPYKTRVDRVLRGKGYVSFCRLNFVLTKDQILPCRRREGERSSTCCTQRSRFSGRNWQILLRHHKEIHCFGILYPCWWQNLRCWHCATSS